MVLAVSTKLTPDELLPYFATCAGVAETLPREDARIGFVLGCELTVFNSGFFPGDGYFKRFQALLDPARLAAHAVTHDTLEAQFRAFHGGTYVPPASGASGKD